MGEGATPEAPPPPDMIPETEPDQTDPEFALIPTSTMGVNLETYFLEDIDDPITRIQRLENVILAMHRDMQNLAGIKPLSKIEGSEFLVDEERQAMTVNAVPVAPVALEGKLKLEDDEEPISLAPSTLSVAEPQVKYNASFEMVDASAPPAELKPQAEAVPVEPGTTAITGIRAGAHPDKIRIVLDITGKSSFKADLDNEEHLLIIEIPEAKWSSSTTSSSFAKMPLLKSYNAEPLNDKGTRVVLQLTQDTAILSQSKYPALSGSGERIVIDLSKGALSK